MAKGLLAVLAGKPAPDEEEPTDGDHDEAPLGEGGSAKKKALRAVRTFRSELKTGDDAAVLDAFEALKEACESLGYGDEEGDDGED